MPVLGYVVLLCLCAMNVAADWSPVLTDALPGWFNYAVFDPSYPDLTVVYSYGGHNHYAC